MTSEPMNSYRDGLPVCRQADARFRSWSSSLVSCFSVACQYSSVLPVSGWVLM